MELKMFLCIAASVCNYYVSVGNCSKFLCIIVMCFSV